MRSRGIVPEKEAPPALAKSLSAILDEVLKGPCIYEKRRFASIPLRPVTQKMLKQNLSGTELHALNRLLLEDGLSEDIVPLGKMIPNVLLCEIDEAAGIRNGYGAISTSETWKRIEQNKEERFQFLQKIPPEADRLKEGLPEMAIDFKRYFTIPTEEVYLRFRLEAQRRCRLASPYLEHLALRFGYYQMRVGLPADHYSDPVF